MTSSLFKKIRICIIKEYIKIHNFFVINELIPFLNVKNCYFWLNEKSNTGSYFMVFSSAFCKIFLKLIKPEWFIWLCAIQIKMIYFTEFFNGPFKIK